MTFAEWNSTVFREMQGLGYEVSYKCRLPFIRTPSTPEGKVKLLEIRLSVPVDRKIYADGVFLVPPGVRWEP